MCPKGKYYDSASGRCIPVIDRTVKPCKEDCVGNPIYPGTGRKRQTETDYVGVGHYPLTFSRVYDSITANGAAWTHSFAYSVTYANNFSVSGTAVATVVRPEGSFVFRRTANGAWIPDADVNFRLSGSGGGFTVTSEDGRYTESYNQQNNIMNVWTKSGHVTYQYVYSTGSTPPAIAPKAGLLLSVSNPFGQSLQFTYNASGQMNTMTAPGGAVYQYGYDGAGNLTTVTYPDGTVRTYVYNEPAFTQSANLVNALTGIIDESGTRMANFGYRSDGLAIMSEHAGAAQHYEVNYGTAPTTDFQLELDGAGNPLFLVRHHLPPSGVTVTDGLGAVRSYGFTGSVGTVRPTGSNLPCTGVCARLPLAQSFDANGNLASQTDFNGTITTYVFDTSRNLQTSRTEASGTPLARTINTTWHSSLRLPTQIVEPGRTTNYSYHSDGALHTRTITDTTVTPNVSRTWTYTYNADRQVLTENGPRTDASDVTTYTYYTCTTGYQCGQLNTFTNALGHVTTYNAYNAHGQPTQITDANGLVTTLAYDARERLTDRCVGDTLPSCTGGELTEMEYWPTGLLKKITSPDGSFIEYTYDAAHRLTEIEDGAGNRIVYTLDAMGNRTAENTYDVSSNLKRTHTQVFNSLNRLWKDVNAAGTAAVTTTFGYDNNGNQTTVAAPLSRNSSNTYDELNRLNQITDPASGVTTFGYDANDNLTQVTDPRSLVTSYTYNGFGDLKTQVSPDTGTTTNTYDSGGNIDTSTDARGAVADYAYDALNRVTSVSYTLGGVTDQTISYTYDTGTNQKGHLTGASDANHSLSWTYDAQGRVTGKGQSVSSITKSIGYGYNADGQLASIVLPSGKTITYGYNANNQVTSVTLNGSPAVTILNNVTYDPFGPITGWTWGNSTTASRVFDTDGKLIDITSAGQRTFGYDDAFRITGVTDVADSTQSWTLGYDLLDRLNVVTKTGLTIGYTYDANGNRLSQTGTSASTYTMSGSSNKLTSTSGVLSRSYSYDAVGNTTASGATVHSYNNANRMKTGRLAGGSDTTYVYNALGQRVKKSGGGVASPLYFMYDEAGHLIGEYDSSGNLIQETVWLGDIPVATLRPNGANVDVFYVHTDQLNTPRKVSRPSDNALRWRWDPTPFGEGVPDQNPASVGAFVYNLRFPGQQFDAETNLNYNYYRDYDSTIGSYVESDPIGLRGGSATYAYAGGNPITFNDPSGLVPGGRPSPGSPGIGDQINPWGARGDGSRDYTRWFNQRFPKTIAGAIASFRQRIRDKICANPYVRSLAGLRNGADDIDINPDMRRFGDAPQSPYERNVMIGSFELKTDDISVSWEQCDCFFYSTTMYVWENTGDNELGRMFQERHVRMGNWPISGGGCCGWQ
jgi:RHS repeat-associated protein